MPSDFWALAALCCLLGLALGSFATALIHRIPLGRSWIVESAGAARSACPRCGTALTIRDLVPVLSWLATRGRCRHCASPIAISYPLTELISMTLCLGLFCAWGVTWALLPLLFAVPFLIAAFVIDWRHFILPDDINIALALLAAVFVVLRCGQAGWDMAPALDALAAAILLPAVFWIAGAVLTRLKGRPALGLGDVKFLVPAGLFIGTAALPSFMIVGGLAGIATALARGKGRIGSAFPFGPGLIASLILHLFLTGIGFDHRW